MKIYRLTANKTIDGNILICDIEAGSFNEAMDTCYICGIHMRNVRKLFSYFGR
jgi:hypothetical protein